LTTIWRFFADGQTFRGTVLIGHTGQSPSW